MNIQIKLSQLLEEIQETINDRFEGQAFWVHAQIMNVKKQAAARRCYLTLEESEQGNKKAEARAVFWSNAYNQIEGFEKTTGQQFKDGIQIICKVKVRYHTVYGFNLDVVEIDYAHTLGNLELERQQTLDRLLIENPSTIQVYDGVYSTLNNTLPLPLIIENIALITAPNSDGQRDFLQEIQNNKHQYKFTVTEFLTTIQGDNAHKLILEQLKLIAKSKIHFDVIAIVRGGGSQTDFKPFNDFELAQFVANFTTPIFTGIGHDRNQSIVDLMARQQKTPTKVAALFVEHNFDVENNLMRLKMRLSTAVKNKLKDAQESLNYAKRMIKLSSPQAILDRGFALLLHNNTIITNPADIEKNMPLQIVLKEQMIYTTVTKKEKIEKATNV